MEIFNLIESSDIEGVKAWIENEKTDKNVDRYGETPLLCALWMDEEDIVKLFIEYGLYIFGANKNGRLPMHRAADYGKSEIIRMLIKKGSEINTIDNYGASPLSDSIPFVTGFEASKTLLDEGAALFNNVNYFKIACMENKTLLKHYFKLQSFILVCKEKDNILSRSVILRFSKTFKLCFKK